MSSPIPYQHVGAYGLLEHEGEILLVLKTRGAWRGRLDLPGGGIEFGEDPVDALRREFVEETGLVVSSHALLDVLSHRTLWRSEAGETEDLHHLGMIYTVTVADHTTLLTEPDGEDAGGAMWVAREEVEKMMLTPFAVAAIEATR